MIATEHCPPSRGSARPVQYRKRTSPHLFEVGIDTSSRRIGGDDDISCHHILAAIIDVRGVAACIPFTSSPKTFLACPLWIPAPHHPSQTQGASASHIQARSSRSALTLCSASQYGNPVPDLPGCIEKDVCQEDQQPGRDADDGAEDLQASMVSALKTQRCSRIGV